MFGTCNPLKTNHTNMHWHYMRHMAHSNRVFSCNKGKISQRFNLFTFLQRFFFSDNMHFLNMRHTRLNPRSKRHHNSTDSETGHFLPQIASKHRLSVRCRKFSSVRKVRAFTININVQSKSENLIDIKCLRIVLRSGENWRRPVLAKSSKRFLTF